MNRGVYVLALATFVTGTVELVIAGILDMIAKDLDVSLGTAGLLVSVYSLVFAFGTPVFSTLTSKAERRKLLIAAMLVFIAGNIISVASPNFAVLLAARVIIAASCSVVVVNCLVLAANIVAPEVVGRAMGLVFMGISASLVLGVPMGTAIAELLGWRMTFVLVAALSLIALLGIVRFLPKVPPQPAHPLGRQLAALKSAKIISAQLMVAFMLIGHFTMYTYLTPFLQATMGLSANMISLVFLVFGIAGVAGGWIGGWSADKFGGARTFLLILILFAVSLSLLPYAASSWIYLLIVVPLWGALAFAPAAPVQSYLIKSAPESADIQISLFTSFMHIGIAIGSAVGGVVVNHYPVVTNAWAGSLLAFLAFLFAVYSVTRRGKSGEPSLKAAAGSGPNAG
ncbi:MFS transporter [Paenibacillus hamazuiensis]|uniref:MFS transporter n=1 Tax=Paenibacillus hamazuiensis TaxID=2936508 RepID=UPI00200BABFE|nr:MFS transporter [Paenibacillus hamazuiensis]